MKYFLLLISSVFIIVEGLMTLLSGAVLTIQGINMEVLKDFRLFHIL